MFFQKMFFRRRYQISKWHYWQATATGFLQQTLLRQQIKAV
jgi:hypothetical protein